MTREEAVAEFKIAHANLIAWGLPVTKQNVNLVWNARAKSRWGLCRKQFNQYTIELSTELLNPKCTKTGMLETIYHELLHTCSDCVGHNARWKAHCRVVTAHTGIVITRTSSAMSKGFDSEEEVSKKTQRVPRYTCDCCGIELRIPEARKFGFPAKFTAQGWCPKCRCHHFTKKV